MVSVADTGFNRRSAQDHAEADSLVNCGDFANELRVTNQTTRGESNCAGIRPHVSIGTISPDAVAKTGFDGYAEEYRGRRRRRVSGSAAMLRRDHKVGTDRILFIGTGRGDIWQR